MAIMRQSAYKKGWQFAVGRRSVSMEQTIFMICMFFGVTSVALLAFTLLGIVLGRIKV